VLLFARGRAYQQLGEWRLALIDYQAADELQADGPTRACAGYCLARQGFTAEATLYLVRAMEAGYSSPEVFNDLGYCYHQRGKLKEAREALDRAIQLAPALQAPFYNRSLVRLQEFWLQPKTDPREGLADIRRALEIGPQAADLLRHATVFSAEAGVFN
jgi:tetratricopeptide (TPR) repeat protein